MKLSKIIEIYNTTESLSKTEGLTINGKWVLYQIRKELNPHVDFQREEIQKLVDELNPNFDSENNLLKFSSAEDTQKFVKKQKEIDNLEIEIMPNKVSLKLSDVPNVSIQQMEMLEQFIEFTPE